MARASQSSHGVFDADNPPFAQALGTVLLILGIAGAFSDGMLFFFTATPPANAFHLLAGVALLSAPNSHHMSQCSLMVWGMVFAIVAFAGLLWGGNILGFFWTNRADDFLHAVIAIVALIVSFSGRIPLLIKKR